MGHIALDILISSANDDNCINGHKYLRVARQCTAYALMQGQDLVHDKLGSGYGGTWNFKAGQSIMEMAMSNVHVLSVLTEGYELAMAHRKAMRKSVLKIEKTMNATLVDLIWSFMYHKLPKLSLSSKLKKAKERLQRERIERRESARSSKLKRSKSVRTSKKGKRSKSSSRKLSKGRKASKSVTAKKKSEMDCFGLNCT